MGNHYHLLIETPRANLDRIIRHINGLYTQLYNRLKKTDGPLFRGRYKAILVDPDAYLLQLSRYIHRNPAEIKGAPANILDTYPWSSYLAYINKAKPASWLAQERIYQIFGHKHKYVGYRAYVTAGINDEIRHFYGKGNLAAVLGDKEFKKSIVTKKANIKVSGELLQALSTHSAPQLIIKAVAKVFESLRAIFIFPRPLGRRLVENQQIEERS